MVRAQEFLKREKDYYGRIFVDIRYAIDNISPFLDKNAIQDRKYISRLPVLERYMELIESSERETEKKGLFSFFKRDDCIDLLEDYKRSNRRDFDRLEKCSKCMCLNCTVQCKFDGCLGCREGAKVVSCDHQKIAVIFHDAFMLDLKNDRTGRTEKYVVLATLKDVERDKRYIIIEGINTKEKFILYYYPGISEDTYGEITDEQEFDYIVSTFEAVER